MIDFPRGMIASGSHKERLQVRTELNLSPVLPKWLSACVEVDIPELAAATDFSNSQGVRLSVKYFSNLKET